MSVSRIARVRKVVEELEALGVERRCAKAVGSMVGVNLDKISKTASRPLLEDALRKAVSSPVLDLLLSDSVDNAPSMLCGDLAVKWAKTAKGGGGGGDRHEGIGSAAWGGAMTKDHEDEDEDDAEEIARQEERELAEKTVKLGYCVARHLGFDSATSLFAGVYAFTKL